MTEKDLIFEMVCGRERVSDDLGEFRILKDSFSDLAFKQAFRHG